MLGGGVVLPHAIGNVNRLVYRQVAHGKRRARDKNRNEWNNFFYWGFIPRTTVHAGKYKEN